MSSCNKISRLKRIVYFYNYLCTHSTVQFLNNKKLSWQEYSDWHKERKVEELKDKLIDIADSQFEVTAVHV